MADTVLSPASPRHRCREECPQERPKQLPSAASAYNAASDVESAIQFIYRLKLEFDRFPYFTSCG
uniref:Uncharacterized protein n=1 Tax=Oryza barthii TaxID=65489 RepID=A0A0D3HMJ9_9ORYZ